MIMMGAWEMRKARDWMQGVVSTRGTRKLQKRRATTSQALSAGDWRPLAAFDDQLTQRHLAFDFDNPDRYRSNASTTPCVLFLAFFPLELVETEFPRWQQHARDNERGGLASLDKAMFMRFQALLVMMGLTGMRRREMYWQDSDVFAALSLRTFENLLYTNKDAGFQTYEEGHPFPDGRVALSDDPLKRLGRFVMELQAHWQ
jgi:hypothetical protein